MIVWLNGTFGVGKPATAAELARIMPGSRVFDAEIVGYMLMTILQDQTFSDFQDLPPWRTLVPVVTAEIERHTGQHLLAVQTVLSQPYWGELSKPPRSSPPPQAAICLAWAHPPIWKDKQA